MFDNQQKPVPQAPSSVPPRPMSPPVPPRPVATAPMSAAPQSSAPVMPPRPVMVVPPQAPAAAAKTPVDMFESVKLGAPAPKQVVREITPEELSKLPEPKSPSVALKMIKIVLIVVVLLALVGGFVVYLGQQRQKTIDNLPPITPTGKNLPDVTLPPETTSPTSTTPTTPMPVPKVEAVTPPRDSDGDGLSDSEEQVFGTDPTSADSDGDGLTDKEEITLGTNPLRRDSDGDELTDGEEVNTYKTNPLKTDTDGDGYSDGTEVKNGYNPNGEGKLAIPAAVPAPVVPVVPSAESKP